MATHCSFRPAQALFRVFVAPQTRQKLAQLPSPRRGQPVSGLNVRPQTRTYAWSRKPAPAPEARREKWNEEIPGDIVILVDPDTGKLQDPINKRGLLIRLDLTTHRLVQVAEGSQRPDGIPVCKIVDKKALNNARMARKAANKDSQKIRALERSLKTIELNWAIDSNDLGHRLSKMRSFLEEGRRVDLVLAPKKRGRQASPAECQGVIQKIEHEAKGINGVTEVKPMEGKIGGVAMFSYQGKAGANISTAKVEEQSVNS